jgi:hypothetical protein
MTDARSAHCHRGVGICDPMLRPPGRDPRGAQASVGVPTSGPRGGEPFDAALVGSLFSADGVDELRSCRALVAARYGSDIAAIAAPVHIARLVHTLGARYADLHRLGDAAEPYAPNGLDDVRALVENPSVDHLRARGPAHVIPWLAEAFTS